MSYRSSQVAAYRMAATHGGVAASDPHRLIVMLMDGALERIAAARGCIKNKAYVEKSKLIHRAVAIIDQLSNSLDMNTGGEIAVNLKDLYDYMGRQLLEATVQNDAEKLDQVLGLLNQIRGAWLEVPKRVNMGAAR
ncbi:MAG TPA: flagellar export chaperone FliS [Steroidobacteraceae bacterium]|nr:flagellar export chaperone FliS [Steroidobacteraceae bacterium]